ncbi:MAG: hypothetical protein R3300_17720 [Candidatus Promineifilaceae bacterium]|nr:hypothetical protein [Candidatus Promineifilaceae bacterium]
MSQSYAKPPTAAEQAQAERPASQFDAGELRRMIDSTQDLVHGQPVIVAMRWILVATGLLLLIWNAESVAMVRMQFVVILLLAFANFYLQAQLLMKRQVRAVIVYVASLIDITLVIVLVATGGGFDSGLYVFYFPAIAVFSVAFPTALTGIYVAATMAIYGLIGLLTPDASGLEILARLLMIAAVAFVGNQYLRIEQERRQAAETAQEELLEEIRRRQQATSRPVA